MDSLPSPLPPGLDWFRHDGVDYEVSLDCTLGREVTGHRAAIVGGEVVGTDIECRCPVRLDGWLVIVRDEDGTCWPVDDVTADRVAAAAFEDLRDRWN